MVAHRATVGNVPIKVYAGAQIFFLRKIEKFDWFTKRFFSLGV